MEQFKKVYRVARWLMLAGTVISIFLGLKSPATVAAALNPGLVKQNAQSFQQKLAELASAQSSGETGTEVHFTAPEVNAAIAQATFQQPTLGSPTPASQPALQETGARVSVKSALVSFEDSVVQGEFLTEVYGKDVYITLAGHLGSHNGYVTFEPTEFKVGDLSVPVSMVNPILQRKLADRENHDKMKLPEFVKDVRVENGELVVTE